MCHNLIALKRDQVESFSPAPKGTAHPAIRGSIRALAPIKAVAVPTDPKSGTGNVLTSRARDAIVRRL